MKRETALAAQQFMSRVELKGIEVPAFIEVMESLDKFIKPSQEIIEPDNAQPENTVEKEKELKDDTVPKVEK